MNRFSTYRNVLALPGKAGRGAPWMGNKQNPWFPLLLGKQKEPNYQEERRTEFLPRRWAYSRVKVSQCQSGKEINTVAKPRTWWLSSLEGQPCLWAPPAVRRTPRLQEAEEGRGKNPPQHQKLQGHNLCSLILRRRSDRLNSTTKLHRKAYWCRPPAYSTLGGAADVAISLWIELRKEHLLYKIQRRNSIRVHNAFEVISSRIPHLKGCLDCPLSPRLSPSTKEKPRGLMREENKGGQNMNSMACASFISWGDFSFTHLRTQLQVRLVLINQSQCGSNYIHHLLEILKWSLGVSQL